MKKSLIIVFLSVIGFSLPSFAFGPPKACKEAITNSGACEGEGMMAMMKCMKSIKEGERTLEDKCKIINALKAAGEECSEPLSRIQGSLREGESC